MKKMFCLGFLLLLSVQCHAQTATPIPGTLLRSSAVTSWMNWCDYATIRVDAGSTLLFTISWNIDDPEAVFSVTDNEHFIRKVGGAIYCSDQGQRFTAVEAQGICTTTGEKTVCVQHWILNNETAGPKNVLPNTKYVGLNIYSFDVKELKGP